MNVAKISWYRSPRKPRCASSWSPTRFAASATGRGPCSPATVIVSTPACRSGVISWLPASAVCNACSLAMTSSSLAPLRSGPASSAKNSSTVPGTGTSGNAAENTPGAPTAAHIAASAATAAAALPSISPSLPSNRVSVLTTWLDSSVPAVRSAGSDARSARRSASSSVSEAAICSASPPTADLNSASAAASRANSAQRCSAPVAASPRSSAAAWWSCSASVRSRTVATQRPISVSRNASALRRADVAARLADCSVSVSAGSPASAAVCVSSIWAASLCRSADSYSPRSLLALVLASSAVRTAVASVACAAISALSSGNASRCRSQSRTTPACSACSASSVARISRTSANRSASSAPRLARAASRAPAPTNSAVALAIDPASTPADQ